MQTLSAEERQRLLDVIAEEFGPDMPFYDFADAVLGLFDDIPGFETITPAKASRYVNQLWRKYRGQERAEKP